MLEQIDINKHNFSKIGKYISNKLHHIQNHKSSKTHITHCVPIHSKIKEHNQNQPSNEIEKKPLKKKENYQPCVGSYRVNYSVIDKSIHLSNFSKTTPHFHRQVYKVNEVTPLLKNYPDMVSPRQKGFLELDRMVGRQQIKGSIRKNQENPHQNRFQIHQFPILTSRASPIIFQKMSPRKDILATQRKNGAQYNCQFQYNKKRLDSHIIPFQKQTSRPYSIFENVPMNESCAVKQEQIKQSIDKSVAWSKQLSRYAQGVLPSYMQKTVNSRIAMQTINLKTLQMNCSDIKQRQKIARRKYKQKQKQQKYVQINRTQ